MPESFVPGASVSAVAMRHDVTAPTLRNWRGQALRGEPGPAPRVPAVAAAVPVVVDEDAAPGIRAAAERIGEAMARLTGSA